MCKPLAAGCAGLLLIAGLSSVAHAMQSGGADIPANASSSLPVAVQRQLTGQAAELRALRREVAAQRRMLELDRQRLAQIERELVAQQNQYLALRKSAETGTLASQRAGASSPGTGSVAQPMPQPDDTVPYTAADVAHATVGTAPPADNRPPPVAPIFEQPGVLTPRGKFVLEPSYQFGYSSTDRVALIGYTIIPAIVIGLIDVRQVRITTQTAEMTLRYGVTNRLEAEVRVPYVDGHTDTTSREIFTGSATDRVFTTSGKGLGDVEATLRYQFNNGGADRPYYVGWLRFKSRTGTDPFDVITDCVQRCVQNTTGTGLPLEMPTGSGFYSLQPGLTWLYPSDPVVFFGNVSYLHNFPRDNVSLTLVGGIKQPLGKVEVGDVYDASVGMGLALNDKASISIGYDQSMVGATKANGQTLPGSTRTVLGSLLVGGSYKINDHRTLNVALGVGVTRDTPDVTLTARLPITF
ncbi:MAG TPA: acetate kinase [Rhodanobacteraceae bacterium]|nr:acetate kinase [Rhodanobacteraceae bacterium]